MKRRYGILIAGLCCLAAAFAILWLEIAAWRADGVWRLLALGEVWFRLDVGSLNLVQAVIQRYLYPAIWDPGVVTVLLWPAWPCFAAIGAVLAFFGLRPKRRRFRR